MIKVVRTRTINRPQARVWEALAAFGAIERWAPRVERSGLLRSDQVGLGAVRHVKAGRLKLLEQVVSWDEPKALAYSIRGLPPVIRSAENGWHLEPAGDGTTAVTLTSRVDCGPRRLQQLMARLVGRAMARQSDSMLTGLAHSLEED